MSLHAVSDFIGSLWNKNKNNSNNIQDDELIYEEQWKRDFEEDNNGIVGKLRERIRIAKKNKRITSNGIEIEVKDLKYISKPLQSELSTVHNFFIQKFYSVKDYIHPNLERQRKILSNINFTIKEGSMTLVIGSPGSGKSSLCKILANQELNGNINGSILFGNEPIHKKDHCHRVAYVRDCDTHLAHLTVKETFDYAYTMLTPNASSEERKRIVSVILDILGLSHRADTIVGDDLVRGVSGGEKRRVTIGVELLKRCQLVVMDEATTGLDSTTSLQIFRALRIIADEVAPVFCTLKQPGRELYNLFDNIIVMHKGQIVYYGSGDTMIDYFEEKGFKVNRMINPAEDALSIVEKYGDRLINTYETHINENILEKSGSSGDNLLNNSSTESYQIEYKKYSQSWFIQFIWGIRRGLQLMKNNPGINISRIIFAIIMSLVIGTMFFQLGDSNTSIQGLQGSLFIVATFPAFQALSGLPTQFSKRPVFYYQKQNNYYHAIPLLIAEFIVNLPVTLIESVVFSTICYWCIGFNPLFTRYLYFVIMVFCLEVLFSILTNVSGFLLPTFLIANTIVPPIVFLFNFFTGFAISQDRAPEYLQWLFWVSPFRYLLEGLYINEFVDSTFYCDDDELIPPSSSSQFNRSYYDGGFEGNQICPIETGEQILLSNNYETDLIYAWYWFLVLLAFIIVSFIIMIIASNFKYKKTIPRDLEAAEENRLEKNRKVQNLKDSLKQRSLTLSSLISPLDNSESENDSENSNNTLMSSLEINIQGKRSNTHRPIYLEWHHLSYIVKVLPSKGIFSKIGNLPIINRFVQEDLTLLHDVSGYVKPGMLIAFMGPSGAGKTTLLDVLSQRKTAGKIQGNIRINGAPIDPKTLSRFSGYVEQNNIHVETETVEEALKMSAALRLSSPISDNNKNLSSISRKERSEHILWVMRILGISNLRDALISELSLEQKKRVTIGVELAANPSLLFLDEPTSGLDAMAAITVMKAIKRISDSGVAVVCTLHQPSELIFSWCTHLLLLAPGGYITYFGDTSDYCYEAKQHFEQFNLYPEENENLADFFLNCCSSKITYNDETITDLYKNSIIYKDIDDTLEKGLVPQIEYKKQPWYKRLLCCLSSNNTKNLIISDDNINNDEIIQPIQYKSEYARSVIIQWVYIVSRNARMWWRSPVSIFIMWINALLFGLTLGLLFSEGMDDSQEGAQENVAIFFFLSLVLSTGILSFIPQIFQERAIFYREILSKTYTPRTYLISLLTVVFPLILINSLITISITWSLTNLQHTWYHTGLLLGFCICTPLVAFGFALVLSCIAPVPELANGLYAVINLVNAFTNGFLLVVSSIPVYWSWSYWIAYQHYSLEGLLLNQLQGLSFECNNNEGAIPIPVPSELEPYRIQYYCQITSGDDMIDSLELNEGWLLTDLLVLLGFIFVLYSTATFLISKIKHIKR